MSINSACVLVGATYATMAGTHDSVRTDRLDTSEHSESGLVFIFLRQLNVASRSYSRTNTTSLHFILVLFSLRVLWRLVKKENEQGKYIYCICIYSIVKREKKWNDGAKRVRSRRRDKRSVRVGGPKSKKSEPVACLMGFGYETGGKMELASPSPMQYNRVPTPPGSLFHSSFELRACSRVCIYIIITCPSGP